MIDILLFSHSKYKRPIGQIVEDPVMFWQMLYDTVWKLFRCSTDYAETSSKYLKTITPKCKPV